MGTGGGETGLVLGAGTDLGACAADFADLTEVGRRQPGSTSLALLPVGSWNGRSFGAAPPWALWGGWGRHLGG